VRRQGLRKRLPLPMPDPGVGTGLPPRPLSPPAPPHFRAKLQRELLRSTSSHLNRAMVT
jgi:hypothetical protein